VKVKERQEQGVNTKPRALTDITSSTGMALYPETPPVMSKQATPI